MPYLRIVTPAISFEQKKIMAAELTDALVAALGLPIEERDTITIQFMSYRLEDMATGGRLVSETEEPIYRLELMTPRLTAKTRQTLKDYVIPLTLELLGLPLTEAHRLALCVTELHESGIPPESGPIGAESRQSYQV